MLDSIGLLLLFSVLQSLFVDAKASVPTGLMMSAKERESQKAVRQSMIENLTLECLNDAEDGPFDFLLFQFGQEHFRTYYTFHHQKLI